MSPEILRELDAMPIWCHRGQALADARPWLPLPGDGGRHRAQKGDGSRAKHKNPQSQISKVTSSVGQRQAAAAASTTATMQTMAPSALATSPAVAIQPKKMSNLGK